MVSKHSLPLSLGLLGLLACSPAPPPAETEPVAATDTAQEVQALTTLLNEFLAGASVNDRTAHERFWSDDLVYTSSGGERRTKADILARMPEGSEPDQQPGLVYTAEDVEIDLYGATAVVAFRLVATPQGETPEEEPSQYFNTGTFLKRDGVWRAVAWQATRIPE